MTTVQLARFDAARHALAEARSVDEVKDVRDRAEALRLYVKQAGHGLEMQNDVAEIKLRAERRAGELLAETVHPGNPQLSRAATNGRLPEGITRSQSSRWKLEAFTPEADFERYVVQTRARGAELTSVGLIRIAKERQREKQRAEDLKRVAMSSPARGSSVLPLESAWPSPRTLLLKQANWAVNIGLRDLRCSCPSGGYGEVLAVPGAVEALAEMSEAVRQAEQIITKAAHRLERVAQQASDCPIPWGGQDDQARRALLETNERQKNASGYCGTLGCWRAVNSAGHCQEHQEARG